MRYSVFVVAVLALGGCVIWGNADLRADVTYPPQPECIERVLKQDATLRYLGAQPEEKDYAATKTLRDYLVRLRYNMPQNERAVLVAEREAAWVQADRPFITRYRYIARDMDCTPDARYELLWNYSVVNGVLARWVIPSYTALATQLVHQCKVQLRNAECSDTASVLYESCDDVQAALRKEGVHFSEQD